ncbi:MAG: glycoside hydrolase family 2 protein [Clostridiaceae bacterium]|nr:glycoside hydrolase family 2 protein [Clostridiaceae bacterium]
MKILLNDQWQLQCFDEDWMDVEVPGDVHSTLLKYGKIEDPFYSTNVEKCRWVEDKVWWYKKEFIFNEDLKETQVVELKFNGLDTFATIYLNEEEIGEHENMFTPAIFDVTSKLIKGTNYIAIKFDSTISVTDKKDYDKMWYSYNRNRVWARKSQMNFRWDWGPRIITAGIWKDVELQIYNKAKLDNVFFRTLNIEETYAELLIEIEAIEFKVDGILRAEISLNYENEKISDTISLIDGKATLKLKVANPKLWWSHDLGDPNLYELSVNLKNREVVIDTYTTKVGIRTIEVKQKDLKGDNKFTFVLNGVETFSKGANWIPAHNFIGTIKDETYIKWISMAKECNMNMLRVWGGGIYEKDIFYSECDKQGLLVWQDFMFTCSSYPDFDDSFMSNVKDEIIHVVKRLRNYACLAIWCGNNEIQWIHSQKELELTDPRLYGLKIYEELMPILLSSLDPSRLYWPSSPFGGSDPNSDEIGDKHNWQVWAGQIYPQVKGEGVKVDNTPYGISFKRFATDMAKFSSEFGMHASPVIETLESCIPEAELYYGSFEMKFRNKDKKPNRGKLLMESYTGLPTNLEEYIDFSMLAQAEGLKYGIEHYRRRKPECSGAIIWQLNDCWPTMSWSIVDYYFRPKAGYYYTKRVYKPILVSFKEESSDVISLWVINDTLMEYNDNLEIGVKDFFGNVEYLEKLSISVPANTTVKVKELSKNRMNLSYTNFEFLYVTPDNKDIDSNILFFEDYKDLNLPYCNLKVEKELIFEEKMKIRIKTDNFARFVKLKPNLEHIKLSDNYFNIMPGETKLVIIEGVITDQLNILVSAINERK